MDNIIVYPYKRIINDVFVDLMNCHDVTQIIVFMIRRFFSEILYNIFSHWRLNYVVVGLIYSGRQLSSLRILNKQL